MSESISFDTGVFTPTSSVKIITCLDLQITFIALRLGLSVHTNTPPPKSPRYAYINVFFLNTVFFECTKHPVCVYSCQFCIKHVRRYEITFIIYCQIWQNSKFEIELSFQNLLAWWTIPSNFNFLHTMITNKIIFQRQN